MSFCAPLLGEARQIGSDLLAAYGAKDLLDWTRFEEYLERLEQAGSTLNLAIQVGHGTVRSCVMGFNDRAPTLEELDRMRILVAESLDAGALGFSTVLYYASGVYACTDKVIVLSGEVAKRDKLYSTHMRDESDFSVGLFGSVEESLVISRLSGVRLQISHLKWVGPATWGNNPELLERLDKAQAEGLNAALERRCSAASHWAYTAIVRGWNTQGSYN